MKITKIIDFGDFFLMVLDKILNSLLIYFFEFSVILQRLISNIK